MYKQSVIEHLTRMLARSEYDDVVVAYLFGSVARGQTREHSDVDIAVLFADSLDPYERLTRRIELAQQTEQLLHRRADVVDLNETPPPVNHHILRDKEIIKGRDCPIRIRFEKHVRRQYFDMLPYYQRYMAASHHRLRQGGDGFGVRGSNQATLEAARAIHQRLSGSTSDDLERVPGK